MAKKVDKTNLPFNEGGPYRDNLLLRSMKSVRQAQYVLDAYKALSLCILCETQNDDQVPDFLEEEIFKSFYEDDPPKDHETHIIDFAVDFAEKYVGCEALDKNFSCVKVPFIDQGDFPCLDAEQLWVFYIPNAMFNEMELNSDGRIPEKYDPNTPYVFSTYHKQFSNRVLEIQIEMADRAVELLSPINDAMIAFLDSRMGLGQNVKPHFFKEVIQMAKRDGHDVSKPLKTGYEFSWFDMYWDAVLIEEDKRLAAVNDNAASDIEIPPGTILQ